MSDDIRHPLTGPAADKVRDQLRASRVTRWQQRSHLALGEFLAHAFDSGLPSLSWTIADGTGALVGTATGLTATPEQQRAAVTAWAAHLGATVTERVDRNGVVYLNAHFAWQKDKSVGGAIRADIFPPLDDEEGQ